MIVQWCKCQLYTSKIKKDQFRTSVIILRWTVWTIQFTLFKLLKISMAQLFSLVSLQHSSHISKLKKDPDFQYMHFWIDQIDREMTPAGISPMPQPLPQQQPSTINSIPSRPLPDDKPFHLLPSQRKSNLSSYSKTRWHWSWRFWNSARHHLTTLFQKKPSMGASVQSPEWPERRELFTAPKNFPQVRQ